MSIRRHLVRPLLSVAAPGLAAALALAGLGACTRGGAGEPAVEALGDGRYRLLVESEDIVIDRRIESMDGPSESRRLELPGERPGELLWLTRVANRALDPESGGELPPELLCHTNLSLASPPQLARETPAFRATENLDERLMTLIQGQNDVELPPGFGFPVAAGEPLELYTMVINPNLDRVPFGVRVRTEVEYLRDADLAEPPMPLFRRRLYTYVEARAAGAAQHAGHGHGDHGGHGEHAGGDSGHAEQGHGDHGDHGSHDHAVPVAAPVATAAAEETVVGRDEEGRTYAMHWQVPPGRHEYRTRIGDQLTLPFDTTLHYATAHLHPYGESIALVDAASGETLVRLAARAYLDRKGIEEMESYSSVEGLPIARGGEYELVTVYDNPTSEPIDAMGILYLHLRDHGFERRGEGAAAGSDH